MTSKRGPRLVSYVVPCPSCKRKVKGKIYPLDYFFNHVNYMRCPKCNMRVSQAGVFPVPRDDEEAREIKNIKRQQR